jgi:2-polyprenyl-3-methyl-5-hydroxy-6-metoxy-1,4-benzoquinol methylase
MKKDLYPKEEEYYFGKRPEMLKYIPSTAMRILEVGCGEGHFLKVLKEQNPERETWGVEINAEAAEKAKAHCDKVLVGDFDVLCESLPKNYFDCIIFLDVLEHLYAPWDTINYYKSLLSDTGVFVSSIPNVRCVHNLVEILINGEFQYKDQGLLDSTHIRFFTSKSIRRMFREQGYDIVTHEGIHPKIYWKTHFFTILSLGKLKDCRWVQFATVAKPIS